MEDDSLALHFKEPVVTSDELDRRESIDHLIAKVHESHRQSSSFFAHFVIFVLIVKTRMAYCNSKPSLARPTKDTAAIRPAS